MSNSEQEQFNKAEHFYFGHEEIALGGPTSQSLINDPKHIVFALSRYKFCARMLEGKRRVLELGFGDGIGLPLIAGQAEHVYAVDRESMARESVERRLGKYLTNVTFMETDPTAAPLDLEVDAAFSIDFLEHIPPEKETFLMRNIVQCLPEDGVLVTGTPNISAQAHASHSSRIHHVNLKSPESLRDLMEQYFDNVFIFGMNDEVLHTGFGAMCHYLWSVAAGVKRGG